MSGANMYVIEKRKIAFRGFTITYLPVSQIPLANNHISFLDLKCIGNEPGKASLFINWMSYLCASERANSIVIRLNSY